MDYAVYNYDPHHNNKVPLYMIDCRDSAPYGSRSTGRRLLLRLSTIAALLLGAHLYFGSKDPFVSMAKQSETHPAKFVHMKCSDDFKEDRKKFQGK